MRVIKRQWVLVNYTDGMVVQVGKPMTKSKAIKIFEEYNCNVSDCEIFERMSDVRKVSRD